MSRAVLLIAPLLALLALGSPGACGGDGGEGSRPAREADERRPALPKGWKRVVNRRAGFNFGVPPGWRVRKGRAATLVRSADRALAVSIAADRSEAARRASPRAYARRTVRRLRGYRGLRVGGVRAVRGTRYPTVAVEARGTFARTGLRQRVLLFALRKRDVGIFTLIFFRSARTDARRYAAVIDAVVRSLRAQRPR